MQLLCFHWPWTPWLWPCLSGFLTLWFDPWSLGSDPVTAAGFMCSHFVGRWLTVSCFAFYCKHLRSLLNGQKNKATWGAPVSFVPRLQKLRMDLSQGSEGSEWSGQDWGEVDRTEVKWTGLRWSGQDWGEVDRTEVKWTGEEQLTSTLSENKDCAALATGRVQTKDLAALTHKKNNTTTTQRVASTALNLHLCEFVMTSHPPLPPLPLNVFLSNKEHTTAATVSLLLCFSDPGAVCEQHNTTQHHTTPHSAVSCVVLLVPCCYSPPGSDVSRTLHTQLLFVVLCCCCCCCCVVSPLVVVLPAWAPCVSRPRPLSVASCCCWRVSFWATRAFVVSFVLNELASLLCAHTSPGGRETEPWLTARRANGRLRCLQAPVGKMDTSPSALFPHSCFLWAFGFISSCCFDEWYFIMFCSINCFIILVCLCALYKQSTVCSSYLVYLKLCVLGQRSSRVTLSEVPTVCILC